MPKLLLQRDDEVILEIQAEDRITVGRKPDNDIVIDSPAVSGHHCKIVRIGTNYYVEDLYSTNGLFLNSHKVDRCQLQNNDAIGIAKHVLRFVDDEPKSNAPPVTSPAETNTSAASITDVPSNTHAPSSTNVPKKPAVIRVLKGVVNHSEFELKNRSTFIGKSDRVQIRIKGTGLFGSAPESAAMIAQQQTGYVLIPVKEGYVKLNGRTVRQKEALKDGDVIQAGGTTLKFEDSNGSST